MQHAWREMRMKRRYIKIATVVCAIALALPVFSVLAHTWDTTDLIHFFEHGNGRKWLKRTNVRVIKILDTVMEIRDLMGQGLVGEVENAAGPGPGQWQTTGAGWTDYYEYDPPGDFEHPKKFSFWINLYFMSAGDSIAITVEYETDPSYVEPYARYTFTDGQEFDSVLIVDQLPVAGRVHVHVQQTAGIALTLDYHAIIEEN